MDGAICFERPYTRCAQPHTPLPVDPHLEPSLDASNLWFDVISSIKILPLCASFPLIAKTGAWLATVQVRCISGRGLCFRDWGAALFIFFWCSWDIGLWEALGLLHEMSSVARSCDRWRSRAGCVQVMIANHCSFGPGKPPIGQILPPLKGAWCPWVAI